MKSQWILCSALLAGLSAATAQTTLPCQASSNSYCEIREVAVPFAGSLDADTGGVGAITVHSWDNDTVLVRAAVSGSASRFEDARAIVMLVQIGVGEGRVWASGPFRGWGVEYEIFVPRQTALRLTTRVGEILVADVAGNISVETSVGALHLSGLAGDVEAKTGVGAIDITLTGTGWTGKGLSATTNTGAIRITAAPGYSARFDLRTDLGGITTAFRARSITATSFLGRQLVFDSGGGGAVIRARTSVGGIELASR